MENREDLWKGKIIPRTIIPVILNVPFKWTNPHSWPWMIWVWVVFFGFSWIRPAWIWWRRRSAESWPTVTGRIESVAVREKSGFLGAKSQTPTFTAELTYSYLLHAASRIGRFKRDFQIQAEAVEFVRDLQGRMVTVSYHPRSVNRSTLSESAIQDLLRIRPPLPGGKEFKIPVADLSPRQKALIAPLAMLAVVGFVLSSFIHVFAVAGRQVASPIAFGLMHVGIFVVFFPAVMVAVKRLSTARHKDFWNLVLRGAPNWVKYAFYGIFAYCWISGFLFGFRNEHPKGGSSIDLTQWRTFSAVWMTFYFTAFAILYAALGKSESEGIQHV